MRLWRLALLLLLSFLLAAAIQVTVLNMWSADQVAARMAWERFPLNLLLIPIAPALTFDRLVHEGSGRAVVEFLPFIVPFSLCAAAAVHRVYRRQSTSGN